MGRLGRRGREPVEALLIACALAAVGLGSCAKFWGFDELRGTRDGGPSVTSVSAGADAGIGGAGGGAGSDAQPGVGGAAGHADDGGLSDGGIRMDAGSPDAGSPDSGPRDMPGSTSQDAGDASGDAAVDAPRPPVAVSIDFVGGGIPMGPTEIAGVFRAAQWNSADGAAGTVAALVLSDGTISPAAVTWDSGSVWQLAVTDAPGDTRMMTGYLDPRTTSTIVVSGLPASLTTTGYDVYVYANGDVPAGITRAASYGVGGPLQVVTQPELTSFAGTFIDALNAGFGNYVVFRGLTGTTLTVTVRPVSGTGLRAPVNGIQIVTAGAGP